MKQGQGGAPRKDAGGQQPAVAEEARPPRKNAPATGWGQGAASALETLRKRDYRGRRSKPAGERPDAE